MTYVIRPLPSNQHINKMWLATTILRYAGYPSSKATQCYAKKWLHVRFEHRENLLQTGKDLTFLIKLSKSSPINFENWGQILSCFQNTSTFASSTSSLTYVIFPKQLDSINNSIKSLSIQFYQCDWTIQIICNELYQKSVLGDLL